MATRRRNKAKPPEKKEQPEVSSETVNMAIFVLLAPIIFIVVIIGISFIIVTLRSGQMPSADSLVTLFKMILDVVADQLHGNPPNEG